jgi:predicted nucleic acid-binding protein
VGQYRRNVRLKTPGEVGQYCRNVSRKIFKGWVNITGIVGQHGRNGGSTWIGIRTEWGTIEKIQDKYRQQLLEMQIDNGESSAIALALETHGSTVILDDYRAPKIAEQLGVNYTGTIGVIIKAKLNGAIASIKPLLAKIRETYFRLSPEIERQALLAAREV